MRALKETWSAKFTLDKFPSHFEATRGLFWGRTQMELTTPELACLLLQPMDVSNSSHQTVKLCVLQAIKQSNYTCFKPSFSQIMRALSYQTVRLCVLQAIKQSYYACFKPSNRQIMRASSHETGRL
ncbi:hypothetical protein AVEN_222832-1 [Araneus ventricosus]|uniref:Uncharacterized protein n=1 Tax=Araneus ventricosus TaxID=182803 RepID=A0A4Y2JRA8_ARAVE|nr:hypothetical protein AVEN_222832-1 [Araneus ventricosus]